MHHREVWFVPRITGCFLNTRGVVNSDMHLRSDMIYILKYHEAFWNLGLFSNSGIHFWNVYNSCLAIPESFLDTVGVLSTRMHVGEVWFISGDTRERVNLILWVFLNICMHLIFRGGMICAAQCQEAVEMLLFF